MELKVKTSPLAVELSTARRGHRPGRRMELFAMPDNLYRAAARRVIHALIAENRRLRSTQPQTHHLTVQVGQHGRLVRTALSVLDHWSNPEDKSR